MYMHCNDEINDVTFASLLDIKGTHYSAHIVPPVRPNLTTNGPLSPDAGSNITKFSGIIVQPGCTVNLGFVMLYFNIAGRVFAGRRVRQNYQPDNLYSFELVELQVCKPVTTGKFQHSRSGGTWVHPQPSQNLGFAIPYRNACTVASRRHPGPRCIR
jgi:hypothetical protein